jgi:hypothetical protein
MLDKLKYRKPNFNREWLEANRYPEFQDIGKSGWLELAPNGSVVRYSNIKDVLGNVNLDFDSLEKDKKRRFIEDYKTGVIEVPIAVKFNDFEYDLLGGNTRLAGLIRIGHDPKIWVVQAPGWDYNDSEESLGEEIEGGLSDNKTLIQIAKKHDAKGYYHIQDMIKSLRKELNMGVKIEMEHTDSEEIAKEIAMDHLWENPSYYTELKKSQIEEDCWKGYKQVGGKMKNGKMVPNCVPTNEASSPAQQAAIAINMKEKGIEPKVGKGNKPTMTHFDEMTGAVSAGAFSAPMSFSKNDIKEAMDAGISAAAAFDVPLFGATTKGGRKDPLKIDGPESIGKSRAVKDKSFPKFGGPGGIFIKIKDKCKKFPYCNQGDINAIEILRETIEDTAKKHGLPIGEVEKIVLKGIKDIFI